MNNGLLQWMAGIDYEVAFWKSLYRVKPSRQWILNESTLGKDIRLHNFDVASFLKCSEENALVLDVGCGMSYYTGNKLDGKEINIQYVDPLAYYYNDILDRYAPDAPKITFGMMEHLSAFYPQKDVSLVIIQNALDHSANPLKGIYEALEVLRIGGVLYLKHYPNEAEKENYRGFHKFNIDIQDDNLVIWNKDMHHNLNVLLEGFAEIELSRYDSPKEVIAVIRKTSELPSEKLTHKEDIKQLCSLLMVLNKEDIGIFQIIKRKTKKFFLDAGQYIARYVNPETKEKIKKIIRHKN